jgi:hypothetical protein
MTKTSSDYRAAASKAIDALADALLPRLRPAFDELGTVRVTAAAPATKPTDTSRSTSHCHVHQQAWLLLPLLLAETKY